MQGGIAGWIAGLVVSLGVAATCTVAIRAHPPREIDVNMLFVPPASAVKGGASGFQNVIADSLWLTLLQYYGERYFADDNTMVNLDAMFALITDLDPKFWFAYWLGGWSLGEDKQTAAAIALLHKGEAANPDEVNYPYLEGFIRFLYMGDYAGAGAAFERAATKPIPEWPDQLRFCKTMAARMYQKQGRDDLALRIWRNYAEHSPDKAVREIAKKNVKRIEAEMRGERPRAFAPGKPEPGQPR